MSRERAKRATLPPAQENIEKLEKVVKQGNYYGAQQMFKSISARYVSAERYSEALDILKCGACLQLENGQVMIDYTLGRLLIRIVDNSADKVITCNKSLLSNLDDVMVKLMSMKILDSMELVTCGSELALLFVETLVKGKVSYNEETLDHVRKIYEKFPRPLVPQNLDLTYDDDDDMQKLSEAIAAAKTRVECCSSFFKASIKWSAEFGALRYGSPELHEMLADYMYSQSPEVDMVKVSFHFVRGRNLKKFASTIINFMGKCYPGEDDLAIARGILMYLSLGNLRDANKLMDEMEKEMQSKHLDSPQSELMQFVNYLLLTLQRDALPLFNMLRQNYKSSIDRDPLFNELLDEVAKKFYGVQRKSPLQGMFGDIFKMMGGE